LSHENLEQKEDNYRDLLGLFSCPLYLSYQEKTIVVVMPKSVDHRMSQEKV
jgi:hypothetical protein